MELYTTGASFYQTLNAQKQQEDRYKESYEPIPGINGKIFKNVEYFLCGNTGHYANECPQSGTVSSPNNKETDKEIKKAGNKANITS